ncbi:hypothetical protein SAMN05444921_11526 [Streptomyces wuyuanensis]|uniref:Uncharacterized protein n=1 Tax=Streptomyces wuyuanensis TaxID=1196353 RepID=A0A1G9X250_9ACTN|nr:hypothetical protein SAMN05444921_11526 [Streptomyces wuyuanensis]
MRGIAAALATAAFLALGHLVPVPVLLQIEGPLVNSPLI